MIQQALKYLILLFLASIISGCAPQIKKEVFEPPPEVISAPLLPPDLIEKKISSLEALLKNDRIAEKDREIANQLLSDYRYIQSLIKNRTGPSDDRELIRILFYNLDRLDERYLTRSVVEKGHRPVEMMNAYSQKRKKIMESYLAGDYRKVIEDCAELESSFGPDSLTPEIGLLFAESLAKNGMVEEAVRIGEKMVRELEGRPDLIHLRADLIRWQLALGNRDQAAHVYEKLVDTVDEKEILVQDVQERIAAYAQDRSSGSLESIGKKEKEIDLQETDTIEDLLDKVDALVKNRSFSRARLLLIRWRLNHEEGPDTELIEDALRKVETAEATFQREQSSEKEAVAKAIRLIEAERFEEAISELDDWIDSDATDPDLKKIRDIAVEKLVRRERDRAARIFLLAKNTKDPERKKELLLSSLDILKKLIDKYPSSTLIDKLNEHLTRVKNELEKTPEPSG